MATDSPRIHTDPRLTLTLNCRGESSYTKVSFPVKYGCFSRLETPDFIYEFNRNHEIRHARSKSRDWPHPQEWLKRTVGNDWVYYSSGGYAGVVEAIGEYYLPNLPYPTNSLLGGKPFDDPHIAGVTKSWHDHLAGLDLTAPHRPDWVRHWAEQALAVTPETLDSQARTLFDIPGGRVTVLPPDARHSDYDVIPLNIADGCLYKCKFCRIKNKKPFTPRSREDILEQLHRFKDLYGADLANYNSLFLGEHDALAAPADLICFAAEQAYEILGFRHSHMKNPRLYLFGSVDSFFHADPDLFDRLSALPFETCINLGLESADPATLEHIGKPITAHQVKQAFDAMLEINRKYFKIEMTCNFIMDDALPPSHLPALMEILRQHPGRVRPKGSVYLSPLAFASPSRQVLMDFYHLKTQSRVPLFLYIIQRL